MCYLARNFRQVNPFLLWEANLQLPQPQALAVLVEFTRASTGAEMPETQAAAFENWANAVTWKLPKAPLQIFFLRDGAPKPARDEKEIGRSLRPFLRWGFFGSESPLSGKKKTMRTTLPRLTRRLILKDLCKNTKLLTVSDYVAACRGQVHRRTAERDLKEWNKLAPVGKTRGRSYRRR